MEEESSYFDSSTAPLANGRSRSYRDQHRNDFEMQNVNPSFRTPDHSLQDGVHPEQVAIDLDPSHPDARPHYRKSVSHSNEPVDRYEYDEPDSDRNWAAQQHRDTAELIKDLPSHRLEELASAVSATNHWKGKSRKSRRSKYATLSRIPKDIDAEEVLSAMAHNFEDDPDGDPHDVIYMDTILRGTSGATLSAKKELRRRMSSRRKQPRTVSWWKSKKYEASLSWRHFKHQLAELAYYLRLWKGHMKKIEGHFGTGVTSYFRFLKWLFVLNIPIFFLTLAFVVIPQVIFRYFHSDARGYPSNTTFNAADIFTGGGWFRDTELYYGYYTNGSISLSVGHYYHMQYAYLFTCGGYYLLCLIILAYSMSKSYRENYIEDSGQYGLYMATKVFGGWMFGITSDDAAKLKHKSLYNEFLEYLSGIQPKQVRPTSYRCKWFFLRTVSNIIVLGLIGGAAYLVYYLSTTQQFKTEIPFLREMALPLTVSAMLLIIPFAFSIIGGLERYEVPKYELYISMLRTMVLKGVILGVLIYYWFNELPCPSEQIGNLVNNTEAEARVECQTPRCWETLMGEQIYRLVLVDFVFVLFFTFFVEFVGRLMAQYCCSQHVVYPEFNIGRNTLNLIYSQTLCWLGTFYSPLLSLITIMKLFIMFYVKRVSVIQNCKPSLKPWRASRTHTIFLGFLFCFFLLATVAVACSIIFIQPSPSCGPYRGKAEAYDVVKDLISSWEEREPILKGIIDFVTSPGCIAAILILLCVGTYFIHIIMSGHKEMVALLKHQLALEGKDKNYLLDMLQEINRRNRLDSSSLTLGRQASAYNTDTGKRRFIKTKMAAKDNQIDSFENTRSKGHRIH